MVTAGPTGCLLSAGTALRYCSDNALMDVGFLNLFEGEGHGGPSGYDLFTACKQWARVWCYLDRLQSLHSEALCFIASCLPGSLQLLTQSSELTKCVS